MLESSAQEPTYPREVAFARWIAFGTSRRVFLRNLLRGAFLVGASGSFLGTVLTETAAALHVCSDPGENPYCNTQCCNAPAMNCFNNSSCKGRPYQGSQCQSSGGCWHEYDAASGNTYKCCDCCTSTNVGSGQCTGSCGGTKYKCVCEFLTDITLRTGEELEVVSSGR